MLPLLQKLTENKKIFTMLTIWVKYKFCVIYIFLCFPLTCALCYIQVQNLISIESCNQANCKNVNLEGGSIFSDLCVLFSGWPLLSSRTSNWETYRSATPTADQVHLSLKLTAVRSFSWGYRTHLCCVWTDTKQFILPLWQWQPHSLCSKISTLAILAHAPLCRHNYLQTSQYLLTAANSLLSLEKYIIFTSDDDYVAFSIFTVLKQCSAYFQVF